MKGGHSEHDPGRWTSNERHRLYQAEHDVSRCDQEWSRVQVEAGYVDVMDEMTDVRSQRQGLREPDEGSGHSQTAEQNDAEHEARCERDPMGLKGHRVTWVPVMQLMETDAEEL